MSAALTNPDATRLLLVGGAAFYVLSQWEEQQHYLLRLMMRRRVRAALTMLAVVLVIRRRASFKRTMRLQRDEDETFDHFRNPWTGYGWGAGGWLDQTRVPLD